MENMGTAEPIQITKVSNYFLNHKFTFLICEAFGMGYSQENQQVEQIIGHNDAFGQPIDISQDQEDLDAIIESISYGKTQQVKKLQF